MLQKYLEAHQYENYATCNLRLSLETETEDGTDLHSSRTEKERAYSDEDHSRNDINREESE